MLVDEEDLEALEEEPDGLAADEDEDEGEENQGATGVAAFVQHPGRKRKWQNLLNWRYPSAAGLLLPLA